MDLQRSLVFAGSLSAPTFAANPMATAEQIRALVKSHCEGDDARFTSIAIQVAAGEAKRGNADFAAEIRRLIDSAREKVPSPTGVTVRFDSARGELADLLAASTPETRLVDMVLPESLRRRLERVIQEQQQMALLKGHNLRPRQRLLLVGAPGCGKTMTAAALAGELGLTLFVVRLDGLITKFMGETTAKLRLIFDAIERTRAVFLFDEFDSIGTERGSGSDVGEIRRVLNSFLMLLEQHHSASIVIAATNHGHALDAALFRRFDDVLEFERPDADQAAEIICRRVAVVLGKSKNSIAQLAQDSLGMSYADVSRACDEALKEMLLDGNTHLRREDLRRALMERRGLQKRP